MQTSVYIFSLIAVNLVSSSAEHPQGKEYWSELGTRNIEQALNIRWNEAVAKNVIIFVGDGMGVNSVTAGRIYHSGEEGYLSFEAFPHVGMIKTYSTDKQVPDSASTATALFCGVKTNYETLGVTADVKLGDCSASLKEENRLDSIMTWAQNAGKATGIVTNTRITHATPASTYAKSAERHWECRVYNNTSCKDIGRQLVEDLPGMNFKVILGGGRQCLLDKINITDNDPIENKAGIRTDGMNLIAKWAQDKKERGAKYLVANNTLELKQLDANNTDYLIGIFANSHLAYEYKRDKSDAGTPSLPLMTTSALNILKKDPNGFVLMVEGGMIDQAHHSGAARVALEEVGQFSDAVNETLTLLEIEGILNETLIIVTSDHGHTLSINGYPEKGNSILGIAMESNVDGIPWTTLTYAVSSSDNYQFSVVNETVKRQNPLEHDTTSYDFRPLALAPNDIGAHGGGDVIAYATGPMSHLINSVHEQSYIAYVMAYAARIGPYKDLNTLTNDFDDCDTSDGSSYGTKKSAGVRSTDGVVSSLLIALICALRI